MKLVVFGSGASAQWGRGYEAHMRGLCRALDSLGHTVVCFERNSPSSTASAELLGLAFGRAVLFTHWDDVVREAQCQLRDADAAIVTSLFFDEIAATEMVLEAATPLKIFYELAPTGLQSLDSRRSVSQMQGRRLDGFDVVLSVSGGRALQILQREFGARRVAPLYHGVDPETYLRTSRRADFSADLSFLGNYTPERQAALTAFFLEPARQLPRFRFLIAGAQYPLGSPISKNVGFVPRVHPSQHASFFSSARVSLQLTRASLQSLGHCPSSRLFQAAACGVPVLSEHWDGIDAFFEPDREILIARSSREVVNFLRLDPDVLAQIGRRAQARVLELHTCRCRAEELVRLLESVSVAPAAAS